ncbi:MAG TPA: hypothetical protein VJ965_03730 [Anaerolineales bacterium]|nr:hypothetical protein [Anaerolineales bacterium]
MTKNDPKKSSENNLGKIAGLALFVFFISFCCCGLLGFIAFDLISLHTPMLNALSWGNLEGFTSLVTMSLVIAGLVFAFADRRQKEKEEAHEKQKLSSAHFTTIHDRLTDAKQEDARRWVYENIPLKADDEPLDKWVVKVQKAIDRKPKDWPEKRSPGQIYLKSILNNFDFIGFIFSEYWEAEEKEIEWITPPIAKIWQRIGPYVEHLRDLRNEPDYYKAASTVGEYAIQWREEHNYQEPEFPKNSL